MIKSWKELSVNDFLQLAELSQETEDRGLKIAAFLGGVSYEEILRMPIAQSRKLIENAAFTADEPVAGIAKGEYEVNGRKYRFNRDLNQFTTAQYIDVTNMQNDLAHIKDRLAIVLIPEGHDYNDGYDYEQVVEDMGCLSYYDANTISAFFFGSYLNLVRDLNRAAEKIMRKAVAKGTVPKEKLTELRRLNREWEHVFGLS